MSGSVPRLRSAVLDCREPRVVAEFYRRLFGYEYRPGDETPAPGEGWLVLRAPDGWQLAFQQDEDLVETTWPDGAVPQQMHLDFSVPDAEELARQHERALSLGARLVFDRSDDPDEPLYVYADPAGHRFCIFVAD